MHLSRLSRLTLNIITSFKKKIKLKLINPLNKTIWVLKDDSKWMPIKINLIKFYYLINWKIVHFILHTHPHREKKFETV